MHHPQCQSTLLRHSLATKASSAGVVGSPVHPLLHVALVGVAFVGELLLRARELGGVHAWVVTRHPRAHGVTSGVHGIVAVGHGVAQHLLYVLYMDR